MPLIAGEGPVGVILAPSRELARQTYDVVVATSKILSDSPSGKYPPIRTQLLIGGEDKREQLKLHQERGIHAVIATPGRLKDFLGSKKLNFRICRFICLDEADRMLDMGFEPQIRKIFATMPPQRHTMFWVTYH